MFEKSFHGLGKFAKKHSKSIIIGWIILALIFLPFISMIFQETSYDIAGSVVTSNTMSGKASNILQSEFGNQGNNSTTLDFILIENADVNSKNVTKNIISMQNSIMNNTILKKYNVSIQSIYTVEKDLLLNFSKNTKYFLDGVFELNNNTKFAVNELYTLGNYSKEYMNGIIFLANNVSSSYKLLINNTEDSLYLIYGIPEYYKNVFLYLLENNYNIFNAEMGAYLETKSYIENYFNNSHLALDYFNNFTSFWNYTMTDPGNSNQVEYYSIYMTVYNSSFSQKYSSIVPFWQILVNNFNINNFLNKTSIQNFVVYYLTNEISQDPTVLSLLPYGPQYFITSVINTNNYTSIAIQYAKIKFSNSLVNDIFGDNYFLELFYTNNVLNYTIYHVSNFYENNETINGLIKNLYISPINFIENAYNSNNITMLTVNETAYSIMKNFYGNPLTFVNNNTLGNFLLKLRNNDINDLVNNTLLNYNFTTYPIYPSDYIYHKFVSYVDNVSIIIITLNQNAPMNTLGIINDTARPFIQQIGASYLIGGESAIEEQLTNQSNQGMMRALFIGILASVAISIIFFRSPIAGLMPIFIFGISSDISLGLNALIYKYILNAKVTFITPTLLLILLLGLTTDYSVYIISRYRNELRKGNSEAAMTTVQWAGHAVFTSGLTVVISYLLLWLTDVPLFSDSGLTNALSISITLLLALTFLPAILFTFKSKLFWPSNIKNSSKITHKTMEGIFNFDRKYKNILLIVFIIITIGSLYVYEITPSGMDVFQLVPHESGLNAVEVINKTFKGDSVFQNYILLIFPSAIYSNGTYNVSELNTVTNVENFLLSTGKISFVYGPTYPFGKFITPDSLTQYSNTTKSIYLDQINSYIGKDKKTVVIYFQTSMLSWTNSAMNLVTYISSNINKYVDSNVTWYVGGLAQGLIDANSRTLNAFETIVPILAIAAFFVLAVQLSSFLTPLRLVLMVIGIVLFSLVISYLIFYYTFHMPILLFMPLFVFITLLAVGLDYDIFMITRVREEVINGKEDDEGIRTSLMENGTVIMVLGLILVSTFFSLYFTSIGIIQEVGVGLAMGVLADTLISWMIFIPAVMMIMKKYNWWPSKIGKK
ncbi:MAG: MMPL family transporter [Thermoplasmata archaeon]